MSNFIERLEWAAKHFDKDQGQYERSLEWQAAREIERLTAENERVRNVAADLMDLVDEMPIRHPQQDTRRKVLRGQCEQFGVTQQLSVKDDQ